MVHIYKYLTSQQKVRHYEDTPDGTFFFAHQNILLASPLYQHLATIRTPFDYLRANIVILGLENQIIINQELEKINQLLLNNQQISEDSRTKRLHEALRNRPYFEDAGIRIYVPLYSRSLNLLWQKKAVNELYTTYQVLNPAENSDILDPFEQYNFALYSSNFTSLVEIGGQGSARAYYHLDFMTLYFINDQGRLDVSIPLFDRRMKKFSTNHMIDRLAPVVRAFFNGDRSGMISALFNQKLISNHAYARLLGMKSPISGSDDEL